MTLVINDRVKETSTTTGTGTLDLAGAVTGFEGFVAAIGDGNTTYYCIRHTSADEWEVGLGTVTDADPDTLARTTPVSSSNGDAAVDFSAGTKEVFCTIPATRLMVSPAAPTATGVLYVDANGHAASDGPTWDGSIFYPFGSIKMYGNPSTLTNHSFGTNLSLGYQMWSISGGTGLYSTNTGIGINEATPGAQFQVTTGAADRPAFIVKAYAAQTASVLELHDSAGAKSLYANDAGSVWLAEQSAAGSDTAAYGQIWVKDSAPNELYFTDDAGTDTQISSHSLDAPSELYQNGPGLDWIGKRVHHYLGVIRWQTLDGTITEETFAAYNSRRKGQPDHHDLIKRDWNTEHRRQAIKRYMGQEIEVDAAEATTEIKAITVAMPDAFETVPIMTQADHPTDKIKRLMYAQDTGEPVVIEVPKKIEVPTGNSSKRLKEGVTFDEEVGLFVSQPASTEIKPGYTERDGKYYRKRTRAEAEAMVTPADIPPRPAGLPRIVPSRTNDSVNR